MNRKQLRAFCKRVAEHYAITEYAKSRTYFTEYYNITDSCYQKVLDYAIIWGVVNEEIYKSIRKKACYNASLHSGSSIRSENRFTRLKIQKKQYAEFPFTKKEVKRIAIHFAEDAELTKKTLAEQYCTTTQMIDKALYVAIVEKLVDYKVYAKIKERSLEKDSSERTIEFFKKLDERMN